MSIDFLLSKLSTGARQVSVSAQPAEAADGLFSDALSATHARAEKEERAPAQERVEPSPRSKPDDRPRKADEDARPEQKVERKETAPDEPARAEVINRDDTLRDEPASRVEDQPSTQEVTLETVNPERPEAPVTVDPVGASSTDTLIETGLDPLADEASVSVEPTQSTVAPPVAVPEATTPQQTSEAASNTPVASARSGQGKPDGQPAIDPALEAEIDGADAEGDGVEFETFRRNLSEARPANEGLRQTNTQPNTAQSNASGTTGAATAPIAPQAQSQAAQPTANSATPTDARVDPATLALQSGRPGAESAKPGQSAQGPASKATPLRMDSIALRVAQAARNGDMKFEIQLDPPELGRIDVKLEIAKDGQLRAQLATERPETFELLQRDARALHKALETTGLKLDSNAIDVSLRDQGNANDRPSGEAGNGSDTPFGSDDDTDEVMTSLDPSIAQGAIRAAMGGVDRTI